MKKYKQFEPHQETKSFSDALKKIHISHIIQSPYHVQVSNCHNFYPTKKGYYNSQETIKKKYNNNILKDHNAFCAFLRENQF